MARAPNEKAFKAEAMYRKGMKLIDIAQKLGVPPSTVRRWKSTYQWDGNSKKKENERSESENERSEITNKPQKGGQPGNTNALKNGAYATEYWKNTSPEENDMLEDMPIDEEIQLIEGLKLATLREKRSMELLDRYRVLLEYSPDGMVLKEEVNTLIKNMTSKKVCLNQQLSTQQTKVDAAEQIQIIEKELTKIQRVKVKIIDSLSKLHMEKQKIKKEEKAGDIVKTWVETLVSTGGDSIDK